MSVLLNVHSYCAVAVSTLAGWEHSAHDGSPLGTGRYSERDSLIKGFCLLH